MKTRSFQSLVLTITAVAAVSLLAGDVAAQDSSTNATTASQAAPQLSYGVPQVLQLSQAKIADSTIIAYIRNSGNNYGLDTAQIIYLKQQGVSSDVINTMLNQRTQPAQTTAQTAPQPNNSNANSAQTATVVTQPSVSYVQTAPSSTVYVIPDTQTYDYYPNYYYPYYGYYGWPYPAVSFSLGWGGYYGGYRGGHGGGGGFHGGGHR